MNRNYTSICHYCGKIYNSIKSTSKYCSKRHNSLYHLNGAQIDYTLIDPDGIRRNLFDTLTQLFKGQQSSDGWGPAHDIWSVYPKHYYFGPVPFGTEIIFVSGYVIKRIDDEPNLTTLFFFKPFQLLTKDEKATHQIEKGGFDNIKRLTFYDELRKLMEIPSQNVLPESD